MDLKNVDPDPEVELEIGAKLPELENNVGHVVQWVQLCEHVHLSRYNTVTIQCCGIIGS